MLKWKNAICTKAILLAVTTSACDLPLGDFTDPHYWGQVFLDKFASERQAALDHVEAGPPRLEEPRTVLLITGVTIPAEWFDPIKVRLERDGFRPVVYEPPDLLSGDLFHNAELLGEVVERVRNESGQDKIDILAECTGGVIARHYIQSLGGDRYVSRLVTFISPQHGVDKAPWAATIAGWPALDDLSPGSEFLEAVNSRTPPPNVAVTSIYSCTDEYIQPYQTSIIPGATNIGLCDGFVGHYSFFYEPWIYLIMHDALIAPVPGDPGTTGDAPTDPTDPEDPAIDDEMAGCAVGGRSTGGSAIVALAAALALALRRRRAR